MKQQNLFKRTHPAGLLVVGVGLIILLGGAFVACSDIVDVPEGDVAAETVKQTDREVFVVAEEMPVLVGGIQGLHDKIRYPAVAKATPSRNGMS